MDLPLYEALFRSSPYPYLVMSTDLVIIAASGTYLRSVMRTEEDIVGKYVFDAFPSNPDDPESTNMVEVKASIARALTKRQPDTTPFLRYSVPIHTANGTTYEERFWSTVHTPVMDENGKILCLLQNAIDVTSLYQFDRSSDTVTLKKAPFTYGHADSFSQAQMHEALTRILNNEREHLRGLFDQAPGFVAVLMGPKHVFELANKSYYQLVGHRDIIGKTVWEALPEVVGQGFEEILDKVYNTGATWTATGMPISVQRELDGPITQRFIDLVYEPYRDEHGRTIGIFAQGYDVTNAVEAQASKRISDERLKDGLAASKMVVWDWDLASDEVECSENIMSVMGFQPMTMTSVNEHIHPEDRQISRDAHEQALSSEGTYQVIIRFIRPDNSKQIWLDSRGKVIFNAKGARTGIRGVTVDVTERYEAELKLREASQRKDEFLAMLAHELRNPLAPISAAAEILKFAAKGEPKLSRVSDVISRQTKHMSALIDDLLDVSRVTRGLVELNKKLVNINVVVDDAVEQARPLIEAKKHLLMIQMAPTQPNVLGDRNRLMQVLTNLLNNATKYTPEGGEILLAVSSEDEHVLVKIKDNGIGIAQHLLPHVFELFTQAERTPDRSQGGLGIGLALVKTMVSLHGGTVTASSDGLGSGSSFTVKLPIAQ